MMGSRNIKERIGGDTLLFSYHITGYRLLTFCQPGTDPKTGDESNIALWAGMGFISIAAEAGVVLLIKKRGRTK